MQEVIETLDLVLPDGKGGFISKSAITQARQKLGEDPLKELFYISSSGWNSNASSSISWNGLSLYALDGSTFKTPDTTLNRSIFEAQKFASGKLSSYPQVRCVALMSLPSRIITDVSFGNYNINEMIYAKNVIEKIPDQSLTVLDKGFYSHGLLINLSQQGKNRHFIIPVKKNSVYKKIRGTIDDQIVEIDVSKPAKKNFDGLPEKWTARMIRVKKPRGNFMFLLTSLIDKKYKAIEIESQYVQRWQIETGFMDIKSRMVDGTIIIRSMSPDTVRQEIWAILIAYNMIRHETVKAARISAASPRDIGFKRTLHFVQDDLFYQIAKTRSSRDELTLQSRRRRQLGKILNKRCPGRVCPRVIKARPRKFPERSVRLPRPRGSPRGSPRVKRSA
jgi:hypothetical protein